jgi:LysW-gamma-L-alpha-aminoadipyl-6-phosphate/LysW-L-glutamyl-5-phosphate reductase
VAETITAAVLGASGYTGGELLRLLLQHPGVEVVGATSQTFAGDYVFKAHPNLRGRTLLKYVGRHELPRADVTFTCVPHGVGMKAVPPILERGGKVVDLSADFRLRDAATYKAWYGADHAAPHLLAEAVYGLPETRRDRIRGARLVSGVGCTATAVNLALLPLARAGLLAGASVVADVKIGSSASGAEASIASIHAERSRAIRLYAPTQHRHVAEIEQELQELQESQELPGARASQGVAAAGGPAPRIHFTGHAVELVRGVLATCHVLLPVGASTTEKDLWKAYRASYGEEPFVRIVKERSGIHRAPDPKLVAGSNYADVGFDVEEPRAGAGPTRILATCAIDNLVKGAAGSAVQCMNLMVGQPETAGLTQMPLHPV